MGDQPLVQLAGHADLAAAGPEQHGLIEIGPSLRPLLFPCVTPSDESWPRPLLPLPSPMRSSSGCSIVMRPVAGAISMLRTEPLTIRTTPMRKAGLLQLRHPRARHHLGDHGRPPRRRRWADHHRAVPRGLRRRRIGQRPGGWLSCHPACPGSRTAQGLMRVAPLRSTTLARRWLHRGAAVVSFAIPAMARPLFPAQPGHGPIERQCPIRVVSVHLLGTAGQLLRVLFVDHQAARLLRSQWAHLRPAPLRAPRRGPDPGWESAAGARAPGPGAGALRRNRGTVALPGGPRHRAFLRHQAAMRANLNLDQEINDHPNSRHQADK